MAEGVVFSHVSGFTDGSLIELYRSIDRNIDDPALRGKVVETVSELVSNAHAYNEPDGQVTLAKTSANTVEIVVVGDADPARVRRLERRVGVLARSGPDDMLDKFQRERLERPRFRGLGLYWIARNSRIRDDGRRELSIRKGNSRRDSEGREFQQFEVRAVIA